MSLFDRVVLAEWREHDHRRDELGRFNTFARGDDRLRAAGRYADLDPEAAAAHLQARRRSGEVSDESLRTAARLGHPVARTLMPGETEIELGDPPKNLEALALLPDSAVVDWAVDVADHLVTQVEVGGFKHGEQGHAKGVKMARELLDLVRVGGPRQEIRSRANDLGDLSVYPYEGPAYRAIKAAVNAASASRVYMSGVNRTYASLTLPGRGADPVAVAWGRARLAQYALGEAKPLERPIGLAADDED